MTTQNIILNKVKKDNISSIVGCFIILNDCVDAEEQDIVKAVLALLLPLATVRVSLVLVKLTVPFGE